MGDRLETLAASEFDKDRLRRPGVVMVAFLASWCPFCQALRPELPRLAAGAPYPVVVADLSSEQSPLWHDFGVEVVPTLMVFKDGKVIFRADGIPGRGLRSSDLEAAARSAERASKPPTPRTRP